MSEKTPSSPSHSASFSHAFAGGLKARLKKLLKSIGKSRPALSRRQIHQWRVLSRRSRATLRILKDLVKTKELKNLRKLLKSLTKILGPLRSLDVSQDLLKQLLKSRPRSTRKKLIFCDQALQKAKEQERKKLHACLQRKEFQRSRSECIETLTAQAIRSPVLVREWKRRCHSAREKARQALTQYRRSENIPCLHQLRIRLKQWRYLLELAEKSEKADSLSLTRLKSLQDEIGALHDLEVLREFLQREALIKTAKRCGAQKELRALVNDIKLKIKAGERRFLPRHRRSLHHLFTARSP